MDSSNLSWNCMQCGMPNLSSSIYDLSSLETSNSFSPLTEKSVSRNNKKDIPLKVLNFQSIKNKRPEIDEILTSVKSDIIIGGET